MANDIEKAGGSAPAVQSASLDPREMWASLVEMAANPDVDPMKVKALADLQMQMLDYSKQEEFNKAKIAAIMEMPEIDRRGAIKNRAGDVQSRYSRFEDIYRAVKPVLARHGLAISFNVGNNGQMVTVQPILSHTNGHVEKGEFMSLPIDTTGSKNGTMGAGSAASYGKRHTMKAMLNIVDQGTDDDGRGAGKWQELYDAAITAAEFGTVAYERWFKNEISVQDRARIVAEGWQDDMKERAARADVQRESGEEK
jgi:hypothetical protein